MSNLIPPLLSSSPPPIIGPLDDEEDDEFGDFRAATDSYDGDDLSIPPSPDKSPSKTNLDINSNSQNIENPDKEPRVDEIYKDFQDRRKGDDEDSLESISNEADVNSIKSQSEITLEITSEQNIDDGKIDKAESEDKLCVENHVNKSNKNSCDLHLDTLEEPEIDNELSNPSPFDLNSSLSNEQNDDSCEADAKCNSEELNVDKNYDQVINVVSNDFGDFEDHSRSDSEITSSDYKDIFNLPESGEELMLVNNFKINVDEALSKSSLHENLDASVSLCENAIIKDPKISFADPEEDEFDDFVTSASPSVQITAEENSTNSLNSSNKFELDQEENTGNSISYTKEELEETIDEDDFDDFVTSDPLPEKFSLDSNVKPAEDVTLHQDDVDDFGDFETGNLNRTEEDDEFGAFGDFSSNTGEEKPIMLNLDSKEAFTKTEAILKEIFPESDLSIDDFECTDPTKTNKIFNELKDVTETNALIYQWSKSYSQRMFLKALNIDLRNILYGPPWNPSVPRFAANLGLIPLEPQKPAESPAPIPVLNNVNPSENSSQKSSIEIPSAQFDWTGSGLENPLDYLEQLVASLDIPATSNPNSGTNQSQSPSNELLEEWDLWLQSTSAQPIEMPKTDDTSQSLPKSDNLASISSTEKQSPGPISLVFDMEIFQGQQSKEPTSDSESIKSYDLPKPPIFNEQSDTKSLVDDDFSQFESPKMVPLRETHISGGNIDKPGWLQPTILTPDLPRKSVMNDQDDDDEFDDFQMVAPVKEVEDSAQKQVPLPDLAEFDLITSPTLKSSQNCSVEPLKSAPIVETKSDDDEFTEFHSSLPISNPQQPVLLTPAQTLQPTSILKPLQPLEPLKPSIQYEQPATINWPEPGVTEDDIRNIELVYSRKNEVKNDVYKTDPPKTQSKETIQKEPSGDDDEWSDFVSVANPLKHILPERTATPDLPLSVLNLSQVQAPKQPVPAITPSGLIQTKLPSNIQQNVVQTTFQPNNIMRHQPMQFQPSIISNQFANTSMFGSAPNSFQNNSNVQPQNKDDEDDWSDFVSSQPVAQPQNGFSVNKTPTSWSNLTPNIITNPSHFESFPSYVPQKRKTPVQQLKSAVQSISAMPDLDFIAPRSRTSKK